MSNDIEQLKYSGGLHWYHWLVVILSLLLTISAWQISSRLLEQKKQRQFDYQADLIVALVKERMKNYEDALWSGVASIHSQNKSMSYSQWKTFATALSIEEKYPGINGIGIIHSVPRDLLPDYLNRQRFSRPDFNLHPEQNRQDYWPITYIEPKAVNKEAIGLDISHEKNRLQAAIKARETATAQITGPIILVQDKKKTPGFLFYAPYYQSITPPPVMEREQQFIGVVYAPFIVNKLMSGTLTNKNRLVNFQITDGQDVLYDELNNQSENFEKNPIYSKEIRSDIYGRIWRFNLQSTDLFRQQHQGIQPIIILIAGIIIDGLLLLIFYVLVQSNKKAVSYAQRMTKDLEASEKKLLTTLNSMSEALITVDKENRVLSFNRSAEVLFGYKSSDVVGQTTGVFSGSNLFHHVNFSDVNAQQSFTKNDRREVLNKAGDPLTVDVTVSRAKCDESVYYIIVIRDLSLRVKYEKALEHTKELFNIAINAAPTGFAVIDQNYKLLDVNDGLCRWLGFGRKTIIDQPLQRLFAKETEQDSNILKEGSSVLSLFDKECEGPQDSSLANPALAAQPSSSGRIEPLHLELQFQHRDGGVIWGLLSISAIQGTRNYVVNIIDISKEKRLLEDFITKNKELEKSNADLAQFAYIASHDLKSPISAIYQLASWVDEDCRALLPESSQDHLDLIKNRSMRMIRLLEDLLSYSKVGRYEYDYEHISLEELVYGQFELLGKYIDFTFNSTDEMLYIPRIPVEIVVRNCLSNAIKHHDKDKGNINVSCIVEANDYCIIIEDDGPGIPKEMQTKIFDMFQTLQSRDDVEGSGIGLAMVKKVVQHYGGDVSVRSNGERGTEIILRWPQHHTEKTVTEKNGTDLS